LTILKHIQYNRKFSGNCSLFRCFGGTETKYQLFNFFTNSQIMANYYNSSDLSNPPHWSIKSMTATFSLAMKDADFKVHKIPRTMNSTAHSLAHQAYNSDSVSTLFTSNAAIHRQLDQCPYHTALFHFLGDL